MSRASGRVLVLHPPGIEGVGVGADSDRSLRSLGGPEAWDRVWPLDRLLPGHDDPGDVCAAVLLHRPPRHDGLADWMRLRRRGARTPLILLVEPADRSERPAIVCPETGRWEPFDPSSPDDLDGRVREAASRQRQEVVRSRSAAGGGVPSSSDLLVALEEELRGHIRTVSQTLEVLGYQAGGGGQHRRTIDHLDRLCRQMVGWLDGVADLGPVAGSRGSESVRGVDLAELIAEAVREARGRLSERGYEVVVEIDRPAGSLRVEVDRDRAARAIGLVLLGSAENQRPGDPLRLAVQVGDDEVVLSVVGAGPDRRRSWPVPPSPVGPWTGPRPGLDLTLAACLIERQGGVLVLQPAPSIRLPLSRPGSSAVLDGGTGYDVLIADSDPNSVRALGGLLQGVGHRVRTCRTRDEALAALAARTPDLLLIEVGLADDGPCSPTLESPWCTGAGAGRPLVIGLRTDGEPTNGRRRFQVELEKPVVLGQIERVLATLRGV